MSSTDFVYYGILMSILPADDTTQAELYTKQTVVKPWLILLLYCIMVHLQCSVVKLCALVLL